MLKINVGRLNTMDYAWQGLPHPGSPGGVKRASAAVASVAGQWEAEVLGPGLHNHPRPAAVVGLGTQIWVPFRTFWCTLIRLWRGRLWGKDV